MLDACLQNKYKTLHGGAIASLVDVLGLVAVKTVCSAQKGVSTDVNISYISGAPLMVSFRRLIIGRRSGKLLEWSYM